MLPVTLFRRSAKVQSLVYSTLLPCNTILPCPDLPLLPP